MMKLFGKFWRFVTAVRIGLANFIFILLLIVIVAAVLNPKETPLPKEAPLLIRISGTLVDQLTHRPSFVDVFGEEQEDGETLLRDVIHVINHAATDDRVTALIFNLNGLRGGSFSKLEEIGQVIETFKESGKPVLAFADNFSQRQYFLASYADTIFLNSLGNVALTGFSFYGSYFKDAADKLSVKFHLFKVGNYKDAAEPYVRNSMSKASREHNSSWVNELWGRYTRKIEAQRNLTNGTIEAFIRELKGTLSNTDDDFATAAKHAGLVDEVVSRVELNSSFIERFGKNKHTGFFNNISYKPYLKAIKPRQQHDKDNIGLIVASGTIVDGSAPEGQIGGDSLASLIRQAVEDDSLKALIVRVDSGGGSAFASEIIRNEITAARANGLPVYVSMGSVAASGGYWISTAAEEIWALPTTITGSIGVWGLVPNISESLKRLGIHSDGFGTTPLSDIYQIDRPLSPDARQVFQSGVDNIYRKFIGLVANARGKTPEEIHRVAQGRVWTGEKALEFGLVDQLGSLNDLVAAIREKQSLDHATLKLIEHPLSPSQQILRALMKETQAFSFGISNAFNHSELSALMDVIPDEHFVDAFTQAKDHALNIYARCLACVAP